MRTQFIALASLLAPSVLAADNWTRLDTSTVETLRALKVRQGGGSFKPGEENGFGETCADAFGAGYIQCGTGSSCYNPDGGESCCTEEYPCPAGSFCLTAGYCCPDGLDAATCAEEFGITLPPTSAPTGTPTVTPIPPATITDSYTPSPPPTGTGSYSVGPTPTPPPEFTGAANPQSIASGALAAVGFLGFLQNLL
ncbi:hypothetical protein FQN55_000929 [Onygenales sp. PD_40]|nr:hypothetical protein FQN55_000929 [Onygenales sp. PD_40]KAK2775942.1 hypothetical protein FQN53_002930 [Emmonsiellopsis sp. PD_33]KAK2789366.1 hypothetical protein FQN52_006230 [Onygenales sp. PD_12]KAK2800294.1 hypothetical protein FQN51_006202 [Onygenales sp. PD_10]